MWTPHKNGERRKLKKNIGKREKDTLRSRSTAGERVAFHVKSWLMDASGWENVRKEDLDRDSGKDA